MWKEREVGEETNAEGSKAKFALTQNQGTRKPLQDILTHLAKIQDKTWGESANFVPLRLG